MKRNQFSYATIYSAAVVIAAAIAGLAYLGLPFVALGAGFGLTLVVLAHLMAKAVRIVVRQQDNLFRQYECLHQLNHYLSPRQPLPNTRGYSGSPDFLLQVHQLIIRHTPDVIVEASSGVSTLVAGYSLQKLGRGHVFSLEHDALYAGKSQELLTLHQLGERATTFHAPLTKYSINGRDWLWYDFKSAGLPEQIDMIIVDGPPDRVQRNARYPALPLLIDKLSVGGLLILDDADRPSETSIVDQWQKAFRNIEVEHFSMEKGMVVIRKVS